MNDGQEIQFVYTNHRGNVSQRRVKPIDLWWGTSTYYPQHPDGAWFIKGQDMERDEAPIRDFLLERMIFTSREPAAPPTLPLQGRSSAPVGVGLPAPEEFLLDHPAGGFWPEQPGV